MADALPPPEEFDLLAAELALGVLEGEERVRALRLRLSSRSFRMAVSGWEARLAPLYDDIAEVAPDPELWPRIAAALDDHGAAALSRRARAWRAGAIGTGAIAAGLAALLLLQPTRAPQPQPQAPAQAQVAGSVAQLTAKSGKPLVVAHYDPASGRLRVRTSNLPQNARLPELWVIPAGGAPHSLGQVARTGASELTPDAATRALLRSGSVIAVTLEPVDGKPHAAPTGDILGTAPLSQL